ncbi:MAG TPA: LacI family DNA-binding transcriptional regulator [Cyclobacteriaceae bacterium]
MKKSPATLIDIARMLNVSASTVSRALHDHPSISTETKQAVVELAKQLNYQPNLLALSLLTKKTNAIGIIVPEITSFYFATVINGVQDMVEAAGYNLMISQSNESFEQEKKLIHDLSLVRVDGFLISPSSQTECFDHFDKLKDNDVPIVIFDRDCVGYEADKVLVDDYDGALQAVEYLIKTGCKRIAHITGPSSLSVSRHRLAGYKDALKRNGIEFQQDLVVDSSGFSPDHGIEPTRTLLDSKNPPDAIFAVNDGVAIGAMAVIKELGRKIPEDISIVGFDDEPYSSYFTPSLTSVWQPVYDMGMLSAKILLNRFSSKNPEPKYRQEILKPELIIRESSRRLP